MSSPCWFINACVFMVAGLGFFFLYEAKRLAKWQLIVVCVAVPLQALGLAWFA